MIWFGEQTKYVGIITFGRHCQFGKQIDTKCLPLVYTLVNTRVCVL